MSGYGEKPPGKEGLAAADVGLTTASHGGVMTLTLNRPERRNALSPVLIGALVDEVERAEADPNIRCVLILANGPAFCGGYDVSGKPGQVDTPSLVQDIQAMRRIATRWRRLWDAAIPVITAVHG